MCGLPEGDDRMVSPAKGNGLARGNIQRYQEQAKVRRSIARHHRSEESGGTDGRVPAHLLLPSGPCITFGPREAR